MKRNRFLQRKSHALSDENIGLIITEGSSFLQGLLGFKTPTSTQTATETPKTDGGGEEDNTLLYIGIGGGALLLVLIIVIALKK